MEELNLSKGCFLDISQQKRKIKEIELGFDFDYNPVCFIATSSRLITKFSLDHGGQEFSKVEAQSSAMSKALFGIALELEYQPGLWAVKGDRIKGVDAKIGKFAHLRITREKAGEKESVWAVYLRDIEEGGISRIHSDIHDSMRQFRIRSITRRSRRS